MTTTIRDHIAAQTAIPAPPPGATHAIVWEASGDSRARWALVALDGSPDDEAAFLDGPPHLVAVELMGGVSALLGYPVDLSSRFEVDGEVAYYVTPEDGGR